MLTEITIERKLPVINGFVQLPHKQITGRNSITLDEAEALISGSDRRRVGFSRVIDQEWFVLPAFERQGDTVDHYGTLKDAL